MLKRGFKAMLAEANAVIESVSVQDLPYHLEDPEALLVDVRETVEREREGFIPGSVHRLAGSSSSMPIPRARPSTMSCSRIGG
jgi:hypothetical protein